MSEEMKPCPNCQSDSIECVDNEIGWRWIHCAVCQMRGPISHSVGSATIRWNGMPRRLGPATKAVLTELVELLTNPAHGIPGLGQYFCLVKIPDSEAFLKEQGAK